MGSLKTDADAKPTGIKKEVKDVKAAVEGVKKSTDERLAEVERKMGVLTRNHDTAVECFDTRTRQLLTWAQEITKAAQEDAEASGEASGLKDPEDMVTGGAVVCRRGERVEQRLRVRAGQRCLQSQHPLPRRRYRLARLGIGQRLGRRVRVVSRSTPIDRSTRQKRGSMSVAFNLTSSTSKTSIGRQPSV